MCISALPALPDTAWSALHNSRTCPHNSRTCPHNSRTCPHNSRTCGNGIASPQDEFPRKCQLMVLLCIPYQGATRQKPWSSFFCWLLLAVPVGTERPLSSSWLSIPDLTWKYIILHFSWLNVCRLQIRPYFCWRKKDNNNLMMAHAYFFYGFYFYFAKPAKREVVCQPS